MLVPILFSCYCLWSLASLLPFSHFLEICELWQPVVRGDCGWDSGESSLYLYPVCHWL